MVDCSKRQKENYKGKRQFRCINKSAELYREIVVQDQCEVCPVRMARKKKAVPCEVALKRDRIAKQLSQLPVIKPQPGEYPVCPYRYGHKDGTQHCSITDLGVNPEICNRCDSETREHEANFGDKVKNYFGAVRRWVANGRPTRSEEEIKVLFEDHCQGCSRYDPDKHACKNCGCKVSKDSSPLANKLAMASEHCPLGRF